MAQSTDPTPQLPLDHRDFHAAVVELVTRVNGFVYAGARLDAILGTLKELRVDPDLARRLLADPTSN